MRYDVHLLRCYCRCLILTIIENNKWCAVQIHFSYIYVVRKMLLLGGLQFCGERIGLEPFTSDALLSGRYQPTDWITALYKGTGYNLHPG
jgi:hypothetical protein